MRFDAVLGLWQDRPAIEALETARIADDLGFGRTWIGEMATYDAFALATRVASTTALTEPVIGPLAVGVRSATAIAMGVASVASISSRTAHVALGTSSPMVVERWHGRSRTGSTDTLSSTLESVRTLLGGDKDETTGFRLRLPSVRSEISVAAFGPRAIRAAAAADRLLLNMVTPPAVARIRTQLDAAGGGSVPMSAWLVAAVEPDRAELDQIKHAVVGYLGAPGYGEMFADAGFGALVDRARDGLHPRELLAAIPDDFTSAVGLVGSRRDVDEKVDAFARAGLDAICVVPVSASGDAGRTALQSFA